uniref:Uncharacterized protein n=1 Tax=Cacopsylla melanoneura TaxID=428564 RepID=A0A8D9F9V0_9HEMI
MLYIIISPSSHILSAAAFSTKHSDMRAKSLPLPASVEFYTARCIPFLSAVSFSLLSPSYCLLFSCDVSQVHFDVLSCAFWLSCSTSAFVPFFTSCCSDVVVFVWKPNRK